MNPTFITLLGQMISFAILIWVTVKFIWPPVMAAIEERQQKIAEGLAAADNAQKNLAQSQDKANEALKEARVKANEIIEQAHQRANQIIDAAKNDAIAEANRQKALAEAEIVAAAAADQRFVVRGLDLDFAAEALLQRTPDRLEFGCRQCGGRSHPRLDHALGLVAQVFVQAGDFRKQREAAVVREQREEAAEGLVRTVRRQQRHRIGLGQPRIAEQRGNLRIGGHARGETERVGPFGEAAAVARERERGAGIRTGEREGLAHRSILRAAPPGRRSAPCGRWRRSRA
jgi:F-type H+-transporting ATPase subunit b